MVGVEDAEVGAEGFVFGCYEGTAGFAGCGEVFLDNFVFVDEGGAVECVGAVHSEMRWGVSWGRLY